MFILCVQFGTNNTHNVANLRDNRQKVRWRHLVPNEPQRFLVLQARNDKAGLQQLTKNNEEESWLFPKLTDLSEDFYFSGKTIVLNGITDC